MKRKVLLFWLPFVFMYRFYSKEKMCQKRKGLSTNLILTSQIHLAWPAAIEHSGF